MELEFSNILGGMIILKIVTRKLKKVSCLFLIVLFISGGINIVLSEKNDLKNNTNPKAYIGSDKKIEPIEKCPTSSNQKDEKNQLSSISDLLFSKYIIFLNERVVRDRGHSLPETG